MNSKQKHINEAKNIVYDYIESVNNGKRKAGKWEIKAIERYLNDKKNGHKRGLVFDEWAAVKIIIFFRYLNHFKGEYAGKPFNLPGWQAFIVWNLFGWKNESKNTRRFNESYIEVAKKNGKSTFAAGIEFAMLLADNESAPEIYSAATTRDQAKIVFDTAVNIAKRSPKIYDKVEIWKNSITQESNAGLIQPVSSEAGTVEGKNSHCAVIDEYHIHKTSEVKDNLRSGMAGRKQPLLFTITTAGYNRYLPCYRKRNIIQQILQGQIHDDSQFGIIFTIDDNDEWDDPDMFEKANPNLGASPNKEFLLKELKSAKVESGEKEVSFKTKHLNMWVDASKVWISDDLWMQNADPLPMQELEGATAYAGLDLSSTRDITAYVLIFDFPQKLYILPFFWIPEMNYMDRVKKDNVNYDIWVKKGLIKTTPGNAIDYEYLERDILEINKKYNIRETAYDPWGGASIVPKLINEGMPMHPFRQGFLSMSDPTKNLEVKALRKELAHGGNEVLRWMCSNIELKKDPAGNIKIDKEKSMDKVDGMVALVMALGQLQKSIDIEPDLEIW